MRCLVCKTNELEEQYLENGLRVYTCKDCEGKWMRFGDYFTWHNSNKNQSETAMEDKYISVEDSTNPKFCPDCETILTPYKVSSKLDFMLEHCGTCNGIWFDKNEWESIKSIDLHHKIQNFFTEAWQKKIREEERREFLEKHYTSKFGPADYERLKQTKKWIDESENKSMLLAYLMNENPYKL
jgi:Zn-finger nucleic acid-binding protein